jgi:hypothetical protein
MSLRRFSYLILHVIIFTAFVSAGCENDLVLPEKDDIFFSSCFESGSDGWTSWDNGATKVQWVDDCCQCRGEEAGCLSLTDTNGGSMAFRAPVELLIQTQFSNYYGKQLKYWMKVSSGGQWPEKLLKWNVMIESDTYGRLTMAFPEALQVDFPYRWQQVVLNLSTAPSSLRGRNRFWNKDGHRASEEEIRSVLSNITNLLLYADFYEDYETVYLDEFMITAPGVPRGPDERICNGLPYMCEMPFDEVVFPGNHNAGAHNLKWCSGGGGVPDCSWQNHGVTPTTQINYGIRYFDIDMCGCDNELVTCHGTDGASGWTFSTIFTKFDDFLNSPINRNEVIVITVGDINGNKAILQNTLSRVLELWTERSGSLDAGELTIFTKSPGDPWPTLGYLVDSNRRIIFFVRDVLPVLEDIGVLSERDYIFDTYRHEWIKVLGDCDFYDEKLLCGTNPRIVTYDRCAVADPDKLVLISVMASHGLCISEMAGCCNPWIDNCITACMEARARSTGKPLLESTPNFIVADYTYSQGNMIGPVRDINLWILQENGFPVSSSISLADGMTHLDEK